MWICLARGRWIYAKQVITLQFVVSLKNLAWLLEYLRDASLVLLKHKPKTQTVVYQTDH
jgi:hypothetical protein